jgi:hypothetical protein
VRVREGVNSTGIVNATVDGSDGAYAPKKNSTRRTKRMATKQNVKAMAMKAQVLSFGTDKKARRIKRVEVKKAGATGMKFYKEGSSKKGWTYFLKFIPGTKKVEAPVKSAPAPVKGKEKGKEKAANV